VSGVKMGGTTECPPSHGTEGFDFRMNKMEHESSRPRGAAGEPAQPPSSGMFLLRLWMWGVPVVIFVATVIFGTIAVIDGLWGLFVVMLFMGCIAVSLLVFHWWVLYRFGRPPRSE
jgi:hypothetical protein